MSVPFFSKLLYSSNDVIAKGDGAVQPVEVPLTDGQNQEEADACIKPRSVVAARKSLRMAEKPVEVQEVTVEEEESPKVEKATSGGWQAELLRKQTTLLRLDESTPAEKFLFALQSAQSGSIAAVVPHSKNRQRSESAPAHLERGVLQGQARQQARKSMSIRKSMFGGKQTRVTAPSGLKGWSAEAAAAAAAAAAQAATQDSDSDSDSEEDGEDGEDLADLESKEEWPQFLSRAEAVVKGAGIENEPAALFEAFRTCTELDLVFATFARLFHLATAPVSAGGRRKSVACRVMPPWESNVGGKSWHFPYQPIRVMSGGSFKAKRLWALLDERVSRTEYVEAPCSGGRLDGRKCLVVGAGPVGLRTAVELALLGANVTVVDSRQKFSRINQLHIWSWAGEDLKGLGAKCVDPPGSTFGSNPDLMHITINELQIFLLKIALLLGVEVLLGTEFAGAKFINGEWCAELKPPNPNSVEGRAAVQDSAGPEEGGGPSPRGPRVLRDVAVLMGAGGFSSSLGAEMGIPMTEMGSLRRESAIGLISNLARTNGKKEGQLRSFSMARQFYGPLFKATAKETGAELENIVYVKASTSHYFVMTPTAKSLCACGVVKDPSHQPLLGRENIDREKLKELVEKVAKFPFKKGEPSVMEAILDDAKGTFPGFADEGPNLFDFSKMKRSAEGLKVLPPPCADIDASGVEDDSLLVVLVGDSLVEPFWPEGLGIIRGFFSALDACAAVRKWTEGADCKKTAAYYDKHYTKLKTLSAATRARVLQERENKYGLDPDSRYRH